jgi:hypothetical protein
MMGWEELSPIDGFADLNWNGCALLLGVSLMMSVAAGPTAPHRLV